jgi:hypothetical protein
LKPAKIDKKEEKGGIVHVKKEGQQITHEETMSKAT